MTKSNVKHGLAQGRFQVIHNGHLEYLQACHERCDHLFIGISDHDTERSYFKIGNFDQDHPKTPFRTLDEPHHCFTYYERLRMIEAAMSDLKIPAERFSVVPFPIHRPHLIKYYVPLSATAFVTIYEQWGREKLTILEDLGLKHEVLWERPLSNRVTTGTEVRKRIATGENWQELVPAKVAAIIKEFNLEKTLQELHRNGNTQ